MSNNLEVKYCIACDDIRPEMGGKLTILGFFGLFPDVALNVGTLNVPLQQFMLLARVSGDPGNYSARIKITDPSGEIIHDKAEQLFGIDKDKTIASLLAIKLNGLVLPIDGIYTIKFDCEGELFFSETLSVSSGLPVKEIQQR